MTLTLQRTRRGGTKFGPLSESYMKMGSRWYGPNEAQFLSRDTVFGMLQTPISLNRYTYANGDPLDYFDPDGHFSCRIGACEWAKRQGQKAVRGAKQVIRSTTTQAKTAAAAVGETIQIQTGRAQHRAIAAKQRVERTVRRSGATTKATITRARQSVGRLQTKIADTQIGGARLRDWGAAYADEQTAKDAIGGLKSLHPANMYRSLEQAGGDAVDEYIAATGHIPTDNYTLFNVAANPAYRMLDKCTGDVTGFSATGCASAAVETVGTAMAIQQAGNVALKSTQAALASSKAGLSTVDDVGRLETQQAYHWTHAKNLQRIEATGLRPGTYATPQRLTQMQAHIDLALSPNAPRDVMLRIDLQGLQKAGYQIPKTTRVTGAHGMPGGGWEMQFPYGVPSQYIKQVPLP